MNEGVYEMVRVGGKDDVMLREYAAGDGAMLRHPVGNPKRKIGGAQ
jgi:hypothetical protein